MQEGASVYAFGEWRLDAGQRLLFRAGTLVPLPPKVLETLLVLVEQHGRVVEKEEILSRLWPGTFVEEGNVLRNVSTLRKVLGDGEDGSRYIETIPKRGYRFVARVEVLTNGSASAPAAALTAAAPAPSATLPVNAAPYTAVPAVRGRRWGWAIAVAAVVILAAGTVAWLTMSRPALSFAERDWVLLADFENRTGEPRFDKALFTAFSVSLQQSRHANVYPRTRLAGALRRMGKASDTPPEEMLIGETLAREIAIRENVRAIVACSITRAGDEYQLIARLLDPRSGEEVAAYAERASGEAAILGALGRLAAGVRRGLGESLLSIQRHSRPLPQVTTASLEALQAYSEARLLWRKGKYFDAVAAFEAALKLDPDFAMAHADLGNACMSFMVRQPEKGREHYERALALTGRTTERERMIIEAQYHQALGQVEPAERLYRAYLVVYPDDTVMRSSLATLLRGARRCEDAIPQYREVLRVDAADANATVNLATCFALLGQHGQALPFYEQAFRLEPNWIGFHLNHEYGQSLIAAGQPERARVTFSRRLPDNRGQALRSMALLDMYEGKFAQAATRMEEAVRFARRPVEASNPNQAVNLTRHHYYLSVARAGLGDTAGELRELRQAAALLARTNKDAWMHGETGVALARAGAVRDAAALLDDVRPKVDAKNAAAAAVLARFDAEIEMTRGNPARAVELLESASRAGENNLVVESLARAYEMAGAPEQAIAAYEKFISMPNHLGWEPQRCWLEAHIALARLYSTRGQKQKAVALLDQFLALWKEADSAAPLLLDARRLRASL
jgi:DNA-binding winged helix-turn-helix (wHTH) protein/tetratricopeptide (TPR) repeat protein